MRTVMFATMLMAAMPAAAQFTDRPPPASAPSSSAYRGELRPPSPRLPPIRVRPATEADMQVARNLSDIDRQIDRGRDAGTLTRREARGFRRDAGQIGSLARRYRGDGLSSAEAQELELRAGVLRDQVNNRRLQGAGRK